MAPPSQVGQPERTTFFIPRGNKLITQLHGPEQRLPSYNVSRLRRGLARRRGVERLGPGSVWVSAAQLGDAEEGLGHEYGPPSGRDARIRGRPIGSYLLVLGSCGSFAGGLANEVLYNTRTPYGPTRSDTVGQGPRFEGPQRREFCLYRYMVGTPRWNGPRLEQSEQRIVVVQTYRRIMQSVRPVSQPASRSCPIFCWPNETRRGEHTYATATPFHS